MKGRTAAAALILAALVAAGLLTNRWTVAFFDRQRELLLAGEGEAAFREWQTYEPLVACLTGHQVLDQTADCYAELLAAPPENRAPVLARLLSWIRVLREYDRPSIRSIF